MLNQPTSMSEILARYGGERALWIAPGAAARPTFDGPALRAALRPAPEWVNISPANKTVLQGPAVLVLSPQDVLEEDPSLLRLARCALPGRPVVLGGTRSKDVLLRAINSWRAIRVLPDEHSHELILDALRKAQEALIAEHALEQALGEYQQEQRRLKLAVERLAQAQGQVRQHERFAIVGKATRVLLDALTESFQQLEGLGHTLQDSLRDRARFDHLFRSALDGLQATCTLLREMSALGEERRASYELVEAPLAPLLERVIAFCGFDPLARQRKISLVADPGIEGRVDRDRLFCALLNLVRNALQASGPEGRVECRLHGAAGQAVIEVEDHGRGMPEEVRRQLFTPFFSTKGREGLGLGLLMAKLVVERHGGAISCTSAAGQGTCVEVTLPCGA